MVRGHFQALAEGQWIRVLDLQTMKSYLLSKTAEGVRTQEETLKMDPD